MVMSLPSSSVRGFCKTTVARWEAAVEKCRLELRVDDCEIGLELPKDRRLCRCAEVEIDGVERRARHARQSRRYEEGSRDLDSGRACP